MKGVFKEINLTTPQGLRDAADVLGQVGLRGTEAAAAIRDELREQVHKLSDEDFAKFRASADEALRTAKFGAEDLGRAVAGINLERLGIDIEQIKTGFSGAGKAAIDAFNGAVAEVQTLGLTADQQAQAIAQAFDAAFGRAKTKADLQSLGDALKAAFDKGEIGASEYASRIDQIKSKLAELDSAKEGAGKPLPAPDTTAYRAKLDETAKYTGDAAERMAADQARMAEQQQQTSGALGGALDALANNMTRFAQVSENAALEYNRLVEALYNGAGRFSTEAIADATGILRYGEAVSQAVTLTEQAIDRQRSQVAALVDSYADLGVEQIESMANVRGGVDQLAGSLRQQAQMAREGRSEFNLLGQSDLGPLVSALDAAAARVDALRQKTEAATEAFEDYAASARAEIAAINGDITAQEQHRYEQELDRLRDQAEEAAALDSAAYREAVAAAEALHAKKMEQLREQAAEAQRNDAAQAARTEQEIDRNRELSTTSETTSTTTRTQTLNITLNGEALGSFASLTDAQLNTFVTQKLMPAILKQLETWRSNSGDWT